MKELLEKFLDINQYLKFDLKMYFVQFSICIDYCLIYVLFDEKIVEFILDCDYFYNQNCINCRSILKVMDEIVSCLLVVNLVIDLQKELVCDFEQLRKNIYEWKVYIV